MFPPDLKFPVLELYKEQQLLQQQAAKSEDKGATCDEDADEQHSRVVPAAVQARTGLSGPPKLARSPSSSPQKPALPSLSAPARVSGDGRGEGGPLTYSQQVKVLSDRETTNEVEWHEWKVKASAKKVREEKCCANVGGQSRLHADLPVSEP